MGDRQPESIGQKKPSVWRLRRRALMRSAGYNIRTMGAWFVEPIGGWVKGNNQFYSQMAYFAGILGRQVLPLHVWAFVSTLQGKIAEAHAKAEGGRV